MRGAALKHGLQMEDQVEFENKDYWEDSNNLRSETISKREPGNRSYHQICEYYLLPGWRDYRKQNDN